MTLDRKAAPTDVDDFIFVLEQTLGNRVHARNLERVVRQSPRSKSRIIRLDYDDDSWRRDKPVVGNWTLESSVRARRAVRNLLRQRPAAGLYVHTSVPTLLLLDVMRRVPTLLSTDATPRNLDTLAGSYAHTVQPRSVERAKELAMRAVYRHAAVVVAQSAWTATSLANDYGVPPGKIEVIPAGADLAAFAPAGAKTTSERLRLLFVGGNFARKGGPLLLAAVRRLEGAVELDVVTTDDVNEVPAHVRIHRGLDHNAPTFFQLFRDADVFVLPTLGDAAPLVLGEALAAGLPIVSTTVGAIPEMAVDGVTGWVVPPNSVDALVRALQTLSEQEALRMSMSRAARALAAERFDAQRNNERVLDVMRAVSGRSSGGHGSMTGAREPSPSRSRSVRNPTELPRRVLLLAGGGLGWPEREVLVRRIRDDELPDVLTAHLDATPVDEAYLQAQAGIVGAVLRHLPLPVAQALIALRERGNYGVVLTWNEPTTYVLALLLLVTRVRLTHISVHSWISKPKKAVPLRLLHRGITRVVIPPMVQRQFALQVLRLPARKVPAARWSVDLRFWRPLGESTDLISCVGREMRDYATLVDAVRGTDIRCHIAAGAARAVHNPWWDRLDGQLPENVTTGTKRGVELRELYARSQFTVVPLLPSDTDNGITAILESFAMAKPVICTQTRGQVGAVEDGVNGLLVPAGSPEALRSAILRLWHDPAECRRLGANARRLVEQNHTVEQWISAVTESA